MADTLEIFEKEFSGVKGFKAFNTNGELITFARATGAMVQVASGTIQGNGSHTINIDVGTKCPRTDFFLKIKAQDGSEFPYDSKAKFAYAILGTFSDYGYFDLSSYSDYTLQCTKSYDINNDGTITTASLGNTYFSYHRCIQNGTNSGGTFNNFKITKSATGFRILVNFSNQNNQWPSSITYDWEIVYFGNNPTKDIVEVAV